MEAAREKRALRKLARERLAAMTAEEWRAASAAVCGALASMEAYRRARAVFCFAGTAGEIDTRAFLRAALADGKRLCLPACVGPGAMEPRAVETLEALAPGAYGIPEPPAGAPVLSPADVEFAVIPCLCCDPSGNRLGRGGGYYDRFLAEYRGFAALVCPSPLVMERVPMEAHDRAVGCVVTDRGIWMG